MPSGVCQHCGCSEIDKDSARGDAVCTGCGSVLEDQIIVSEVQFQENSGGGSNVIGQFVSADGGKAHSMGSSFHHGVGQESRAVTLQNGKKRIQALGNQLRLNQHCIDTAFNFFKMAVMRRITRGRKTSNVVAACLYLVCRTEGTPHMLLDFSDLLQVNVFTLGRTYLHMAKELCINVPAIDPCLMIPRFAHKLEFGDRAHEVSMTALRLVSRMKRDWMHVGRRPSGLCGAALLVASRIHDFSRSQKDIIKVVKIGETTIRKRLTEFERTATSELTVDEFYNIDLEQECDPPSFTESKQKAKIAQLEDPEITAEMAELQKQIEKALEATPKRGRIKYSIDTVDDASSPCDSPTIEEAENLENATEYLEKEIITDVLKETGVQLEIEVPNTPKRSKTKSPIAFIPGPLRGVDNTNCDDIDTQSIDSDDTEDQDRLAEVGGGDADSVLMPPPWGSTAPVKFGPGPTAASLGLKESVEECLKINENKGVETEDGELDVTGLDDDELDQFILNEAEVRRKTVLWTQLNADYILQQKEKADRLAKEQETGTQKQPKKKKTRKKAVQASTAGEAIEKIIQEKKISSKINYDVLKDLNKWTDVKKPPTPVIPTRTPVLSAKAFTSSPVCMETNSTLSDLSGSKTKRKITESSIADEEPVDKKPTTIHDVLVETGPVQYQPEESEDVEYDEEFEEDEQPVSAAQLLGHSTEEGYDYQDGYGDDEDMD